MIKDRYELLIPKEDVYVSDVTIIDIATTSTKSIFGMPYSPQETTSYILSLKEYVKNSVENDKVLRIIAEDNLYTI